MFIKWLRKHLMVIMAAYVILLPIVISGVTSSLVASSIAENRTKIAQVKIQLEQSQLQLEQGQISNGCHRLNVLRKAQDNNDYEVYQFFVYTSRLLEISAKHPLQHPKDKRVAREARRATIRFASRLDGIAKHLTWTPLTDCKRAELEGLKYATPAPKTFARHRYHRQS